jgi:probable HAF family extracellular repeat protein
VIVHKDFEEISMRHTLLLSGLAAVLATSPVWLAAQQTQYKVVTLPTLGGTAGQANSLDNRGWAAGVANFAGDTLGHAALWANSSSVTDLGALGGPAANSAVAWPIKSDNGIVVGISDTADDNPLGEAFSCWPFFTPGTPTRKICNGFRWDTRAGMTKLPAFPGGYDSYATAANARGQIVGWAENGIHDPSCDPAFQVLQFRGVIWQPDGRMQELTPLPGDSTSTGDAINDLGQVVGISGACGIAVGDISAAHAVLWNNGVPRDLGNLGGHAWNTPTAINNHGTVVGFGLPAGQDGTHHFQAFVWTKASGMQALPAGADDTQSEALGVNDKDQIVGLSRGPSGIRAVLWENGVMIELNNLTVPGSPYLLYANDINDAGQIAGEAFDANTGEAPGFVAVPLADSAAVHTTSKLITVPPSVVKKAERDAFRFGRDPTR